MTIQFRPILFLPVESTPRELDYKLNIARHFCQTGFDVMIGNPSFIRDELKYKNYKGIFLEKGVNPAPEYYKYLLDKGIFLFDLGDEGASEPVYSLPYDKCADSLKSMHKIFLWGKAQQKKLLDLYPSSELKSKYKIIGNPGFDLCLPKFREYNKALSPLNIQDYILINTNFGSFDSYSVDEQIEACPEISPNTIKLLYKYVEIEKKQWGVFVETIQKIIERYPAEQFVIRPHPVEKTQKYFREFSKYPNVLISKEGNVNYVLSGSKLVIHKDCTTAMQAYIMGIPSISVGNAELRESYPEWSQMFSSTPDTLDETIASVDNILNNGSHCKDVREKIKKSATNALAEWFAGAEECTPNLLKYMIQGYSLGGDEFPYKLKDTRPWLARLKLAIRRYLPLHYNVAKATRETLIEYTKRDIEKRLGLFEEVDPLGINYKVKKIYPNTYLIRKK